MCRASGDCSRSRVDEVGLLVPPGSRPGNRPWPGRGGKVSLLHPPRQSQTMTTAAMVTSAYDKSTRPEPN